MASPRSSSRPTRRASRSAGSSRRWGSRARRPASSSSTTAACRPRTCSARRATASASRCGCSTARGPGSPRRGSGSRRARPTTRSSTRRRARRSASRSRTTSSSPAMLADMETKCEAARGLLYRCAQAIDAGADGPELTKLSAMTKLFCTDVAMEVTTDAVQVLGGYGYIQEYPVERMMRDAKITQIYEGTNQIQRLVIAREMLRKDRSGQCRARVRSSERRPRPLPGGRDHEGRPVRLLRRGRARDRAAPARPAVHDEALARGARRAAASSRSRRRRGCPTGSRRGSSGRGRARAASRLVDFPLVNSRDALLWMVQMHCIDMNAWYSRVDKPDRPDFVLFDLDPPDEPTASRSRSASRT